MRKELKWILDVLQDKPELPEKGLDWYWILGFLELNRIGGYFFNRSGALGIELPQAAERRLSQILKEQTLRNDVMRKYIQDICIELRYEKIKFAFLKGSVMSNTNFRLSEKTFSCMALSADDVLTYRKQVHEAFYGPGERVSNDIDILVRQKDITVVSELLKQMGFIQGYYDFKENRIVPLPRAEILSRRMNRGETAPFLLQTQNPFVPFIEVDVNFSLGYLPNSNEEMLTDILKEPIDYAGNIDGGIRSLKLDDFFLHLILHQSKESTLYSMVKRNKDVELYKLLDLFLLIKRGYLELSGLYNKVRRYALEVPVCTVMAAVSQAFPDFRFADYAQMFCPGDRAFVNEVNDPPAGRSFIWKNTFSERLDFFDREQFLIEKGEYE